MQGRCLRGETSRFDRETDLWERTDRPWGAYRFGGCRGHFHPLPMGLRGPGVGFGALGQVGCCWQGLQAAGDRPRPGPVVEGALRV